MARRGRGQALGPAPDGPAARGSRAPPGEARERAVQPVGHRAQGVVVERVHLARVDAAVGQHGVPALPHRGRPHRHRVQPGGAARLQHQPVGHVEVAGAGQGVHDQRGADEPGADPEAGRPHQVGQAVPCVVALVGGGQQGPGERQGVHRRGVAEHPPAGCHELAREGVPDLAGEASVLLGHVGVAGHGRGQAHDLRRAGQIGRGHHVRVGLGLERGVMGSGRVQPVAELEATGPQAVDAGQPGDVVDPGAHARQLPRQQPDVAGALVEDPGHERRGVAPGRRGQRRLDDVGDDQRHRPVRPLLGGEIGQPASSGSPRCRTGSWPSARRPGGHRSSPAARRAGGSRWARRRSCPASPRRRSRGTGPAAGPTS